MDLAKRINNNSSYTSKHSLVSNRVILAVASSDTDTGRGTDKTRLANKVKTYTPGCGWAFEAIQIIPLTTNTLGLGGVAVALSVLPTLLGFSVKELDPPLEIITTSDFVIELSMSDPRT